MSSGMSASTGSFFIVGGSCFRAPSMNCANRGMRRSECSIFVGLYPLAREIFLPMAVIAQLTVLARTVLPRP